VTTSSTLYFVFSRAGTVAQSPPARKPAAQTRMSTATLGRAGALMPTQVAAMAPARSCPSAPMFQNLARKAKATASPVNVRGAAFTQVSRKLYRVPRAPLKRDV